MSDMMRSRVIDCFWTLRKAAFAFWWDGDSWLMERPPKG
jgi:hypothetical protein